VAVTKAKGRARREAGLVDLTGKGSPEAVDEIEILPTWEDEVVQPAFCHIDGCETQVVTREVRSQSTGELKDFAVILNIRETGAAEWHEVERVDCAHGSAHVHRMTNKGTEVKDESVVPSSCRQNFDGAYGWALDYIWDMEERLKSWR
jgi:hypothetical protein